MKTIHEDQAGVAGRAARPSRRTFLKALGAGLLVAATGAPATGQEQPRARRRNGGGGGGGGGGGAATIAARVHIGKDGVITVMTGKVECGQGSRAEITQAAAEELRVPPGQVAVVMGDTRLCPDDGGTYGSGTTPRTVPAVRNGSAGALAILTALACEKWGVAAGDVEARDGKILHAATGRSVSYGELVGDESAQKFAAAHPGAGGNGVTLTAVKQWRVLGTSFMRPNARDLVTGNHAYPSDVRRPGMLYGKVLRPPSFGAKLTKVDLSAARAIDGVVAVQDGDFVGVAAPSSFVARKAIDALAKTAAWEEKPQIGVAELYDRLLANARGGGVPANPFAADLAGAHRAVKQAYHVPYVQHAPMEPRAAVAEWEEGRVTVWTGTQNPFGVRGELQRALGLAAADAVRVVVPDFGGGFGGKHSGEAALEAARLARGAGRPVWVRWTHEEEFTWAYFRPAGVILAEAGLGADGQIASWYFVNVNSGPSGLATPYRVGKDHAAFVPSDGPLRAGSYRGLAATANHFARESFMDELALAAEADPLAFRLRNLADERLAAVLRAAAEKFGWDARWPAKRPGVGVGLACGTEKGSYVAACAEVAVDPKTNAVAVRTVTQAYECGKIINPANLLSQVQGALVMGLGPALREEIRFDNGRVTNGTFTDYRVPRLADVPETEIVLLDRPDLPPAGAGETPIVAIAPAIANAVFHATGVRVRKMPIELEPARAAG